MKLKPEFYVGCLVVFVAALLFVFATLLGMVGPFQRQVKYYALFGFAGGVEVGSPVRVSGVKVGKVERIEFLAATEQNLIDNVSIRVRLSVSEKAAPFVRNDSRLYVNMAGIIGERYIEISPGSQVEAPLAPESEIRGVDPPRIDQLLSQGYGVFGRVQEFLDQNEKSMTEFLTQLNRLIKDTSQILKSSDKKIIVGLLENMNAISSDVRQMTKALRDPDGKEFFETVSSLMKRAKELDGSTFKRFFQDEGIRARIF